MMFSKSTKDELITTTKALLLPGKGLLMLDEICGPLPALEKTYNKDKAKRSRELILTLPHLSDYINGIIFDEEAIQEITTNERTFVDIALEQNIKAGIKLDQGFLKLNDEETGGEIMTIGLDGLSERCSKFRYLGCTFTKWTTLYQIDDSNKPSAKGVLEKSKNCGQFALVCQENGLVPILHTDISTTGSSYTLEQAEKVTEEVLFELVRALREYEVELEQTILMLTMVLPGNDYHKKYNYKEVGQATVIALKRSLMPAIAGIAFSTGNQKDWDFTARLNAIRQYLLPWTVTYTFGSSVKPLVWQCENSNVEKVRNELMKRLKANSLATLGLYR